MKNLFLSFPKLTGPLRSIYNYFVGEKEIKSLFYYLNKIYLRFNDVGANYGVYTFLFGPRANKIFVFEPIEECVEYIKAGYRKNNIEYINKILSDTNEEKMINIPIENKKKIYGKSSVNNQFSISEKRMLPTLCLDQFVRNAEFDENKISIIKIDSEGHELNIVYGGRAFLSNSKILLLIEIEKRHNSKFNDVFNTLIQLNYDVFVVKNNNLLNLQSMDEIEDYMQTENNFVFKNF